MKIVIDISKEDYNYVCERVSKIRAEQRKTGYAKDDILPFGFCAIASGTVLPDNAVVLSKEVADKMFPPFYKYVTGVVKENDNDT